MPQQLPANYYSQSVSLFIDLLQAPSRMPEECLCSDCVTQVISPPRRQPLPENPYSDPLERAACFAYDKCLWSEREATEDVQLMYARCLGYLITEAPDDVARRYLSFKILGCNKMDLLAQFYICHLFRLFRKDKGHTRPSYLSRHPSFTRNFLSIFSLAPYDHKTAKHAALVRDKYRCMVTGLVDSGYYSVSVDEPLASNPTAPKSTQSDFSYIFPADTYRNFMPRELNDTRVPCCASIGSIVFNYGHISILDDLKGPDGHRLSNGLTLSLAVRDEFDKLNLWFEAVPHREDTYRICTSLNNCIVDHLPSSRIVTFKTTTGLQLPDARYLRLHATVCRVAHLSDIAGYLDAGGQVEREIYPINF